MCITPNSVETFTVTGSSPVNNYANEPYLNGDVFVDFVNHAGMRVVGVIDGAKAPYDYTVTGLPNDAYASNLMKSLVEQNFSLIKSLPEWEDAFDAVILSYQLTFDVVKSSFPHFKCEDYRYFNGACAFALAIIDEKTGDCVLLQATDCYAVVRQKGVLKSLSNYDEDAVVNSGLLNRSPLLSDWLDQGIPLDKAKKLEMDRVLGNRKRVYNKCQSVNNMGMAVMNGDLELLDHMQVDKFNLKDTNTDALVLMSDGFMCKHDDIVKSAQGALDKGAENFYMEDIVPLWGNTEKDVMTDVTCVVLKY